MAYSVRLSGTVLSSLLYECANSETDIEGFLLGVLSHKTTLTNSDSSEPIEKRQDYIIIHGYQRVQEKPYDHHGNLIKHTVAKQQKDLSSLVGYFKFRRQTDTSLSVRDQLWMTSWSNTIPHGCMAILTAHPNALTDKSTQTYEFAFWDMKHTDNKLPLEITNMKESTTGYKNFMSNAPYQTTASSSNKRLTTMSPSQIIIQQFDNMYQESFQALQTSIQSVMDKEAEIEKLKQEIELHKSEIKK